MTTIDRYSLFRAISSDSVKQLEYAVARFERFLGRACDPPLDFNDDSLNRFIVWMESKDFATETIRGTRCALLALWKFESNATGLAPPKNVRRVKPETQIVRAWTQDQIMAIVAQCDMLKGSFRYWPSLRRSLFAKAFCLTAYQTGFRRSDVLMIKRSWIGSDGRIAIVQHKTNRTHIARLRPRTIAMIDEMGTDGRSTIFGGVVSNRRLSRMLEGVFSAAGIPEGSLKWFRRSGATHVEMQHPGAGWKFLGHTTPRVAEQSYLDRMQIGQEPLMPPEIEERDSADQNEKKSCKK